MMMKDNDESVEINSTHIGLLFLAILIEFYALLAQDQAKLMCY